MEGTVFTPSLQGIKNVKSESGVILTKPFLEVCKHILPVLDKFGSAMSIVKNDIGGNITRLETKYASDPSKYEQLHSMVKVEIRSKTAKSSSSCTNGLLWLTRTMDFLVALFHNLVQHPDWQMSQACSDAYSKTLKKWHGWLASSSFSEYLTIPEFQVAIKLAPDRKKFMEIISGSGDINADIEKFCATFSPLLAENHRFLVAVYNRFVYFQASVGMDDLKAS
uniref:Glycolipid transfer protein domain-containing protein n=1 Tax=Oryza glumipatula TaxID=40148 RepID=A0A0E0AJ75_9ORYZ